MHLEDRHLLGFKWQVAHYMDRMLLFGLCWAPKIFTVVADALEWILHTQGVAHINHYLDDFIVMGRGGTTECAQALDIVTQACASLG